MDDKRSENLLLERFQKLEVKETVLDGISDVLLLLDAQTYVILDVNRASLNLYGRSREEVIGKRCHEFTNQVERSCPTHGHGPCPVAQILKAGRQCFVLRAHMGR